MVPQGFSHRDFTVVIATRNRRHLVARAIVSALAQNVGSPEVVVVDDASTDGSSRYISTIFPAVRLHRMETQSGPGPCRNLGIQMAAGRWVVILDDDDELRPDALGIIGARLAAFPDPEGYPVFKFRRNDGTLTVPFQLSGVADLWGKERRGEFISVWNRARCLADGCGYPTHRLGAEGPMWIELADRYGLPTWADCVGIVHRDAGTWLLRYQTDVPDATDRAQIQEDILRLLTPHETDERVGEVVTERLLIAGLYWLMAGQRRKALQRAWQLLPRRPQSAAKLLLACGLPRWVIVRRFRARRDREDLTPAPLADSGWQ